MKTKFTSLVLTLVSAFMFTSCGDSKDKVIDDTIDYMEEVAEAIKDEDEDKLKELEEKSKELEKRMLALDLNLEDYKYSLSWEQTQGLRAGKEKIKQAARVPATRQILTTMITYLDEYRDRGRNGYPTESQGLEALDLPDTLLGPRAFLTKDPWGNPYTYKFPGSKKPNEPEVISNGPDGVSGNEDDLSSQD